MGKTRRRFRAGLILSILGMACAPGFVFAEAGQSVTGYVSNGEAWPAMSNAYWTCSLANATSQWATQGDAAPCDAAPWYGCLEELAAPGSQRFRFEIVESTRGGPFMLTPEAHSDIGIRFYSASSILIDRVGIGQPEVGDVPIGAQFAEICLAAGGPSNFTYAAG